MKKKYILNDQAQFVGYDLVDDDYIAKNNLETCILMPEGLYEPQTFDFGTERWSGATYEEWLANQPEPENIGPTEQDLINAQLLQQAAAQQMTNAEIVKEIATIKGEN